MITPGSPFHSQTLFLVEVSTKIVVQLNTVNEKKTTTKEQTKKTKNQTKQLHIFLPQMQRLLSYNFIAQRKCDG